MKKTRKILSLFLAVLMICMSVPIANIGTFKVNAAEYKTGDIIEFGSYPQTKVTDEALISEFNSLYLKWNSYNYYQNGYINDFMKYTDLEYNGVKYRGVTFSASRPGYVISSSSNIENINGYKRGEKYWFAYEPLKWRVLDPTEGLVLCENIIDSQNFDISVDGDLYAYSTIIKWLNEDFYNNAFSRSEKSQMGTTELNDVAGKPSDKIFFMSVPQLINPDYGFNISSNVTDVARVTDSTDYAKCQGLSSNSYWTSTRTEYWYSYYPGVIDENGCLFRTKMPYDTSVGVRPAFCFGNEVVDETNMKFRPGYNFDDDSYSFFNFGETTVLEYYTNMFGKLKGTVLCLIDEAWVPKGHCFGMAYTAAATSVNYPSVSSYVNTNYQPYSRLKDIDLSTYNNDLLMNARHYIKYAQISQLSSSVQKNVKSVQNIKLLYNAVSEYVNNNGKPVLILLNGGRSLKDETTRNVGHALFAIGIDGNDILVYDSNDPQIKRLNIYGDNWSYCSGDVFYWDSREGCPVSYLTDVNLTYKCIKGDMQASLRTAKLFEEEENVTHEQIAKIAQPLDKDNLLVADEKNCYSFDNAESMLEIKDIAKETSNELNSDTVLYWLTNGNAINAKNTSDNEAVVKLVGNELKIEAELPKEAKAEIVVDEEAESKIDLDVKSDEEVKLSFETADVSLEISGTASATEVTATQTDKGLIVTGLSDGKITISDEANGVTDEEEFSNAVGGVEINYDDENALPGVEVDYETSNHSCSCLCHNENPFIKGFIYPIVRFFWKIFGMNKTCSCGERHY